MFTETISAENSHVLCSLLLLVGVTVGSQNQCDFPAPGSLLPLA